MNKQVENLYKNYYNKHLTINETSCKIPLLGIIKGSKILFVGQNPGQPFESNHIEIFKNFQALDYKGHQDTFKQSWVKSRFLRFIKRICDEASIDFGSDISVTNIVKHWTKDNTKPVITEDDQILLLKEIKILQPDYVVYLSKFAYNNFKYKDKVTSHQLAFAHPASKYYSKNYASQIAKTVK